MKKFFFCYSILLKSLVFLFLIKEFVNKNNQLSLCFGFLLLLFIILSFVKKIKYKYIFFLEHIVYLFIFIYEFNHLYQDIPYWDTFMHSFTGFFWCILFLLFFLYLKRKKKMNFLCYSFFIAFFSFCFSLTIGVLFEIYEYSTDNLMHKDMQKDMFVSNIYTTKYDKKEKELLKIEDIHKTTIYYGKNQEFTILEGYLDIGIQDTMKDLYVNFIGAMMGSFYVFFYLKEEYTKNML